MIADLHLPASGLPAVVQAVRPAQPAAPLAPAPAPLDFKSLQRYMPVERRTAKFFRWTNWFTSTPSLETK